MQVKPLEQTSTTSENIVIIDVAGFTLGFRIRFAHYYNGEGRVVLEWAY